MADTTRAAESLPRTSSTSARISLNSAHTHRRCIALCTREPGYGTTSHTGDCVVGFREQLGQHRHILQQNVTAVRFDPHTRNVHDSSALTHTRRSNLSPRGSAKQQLCMTDAAVCRRRCGTTELAQGTHQSTGRAALTASSPPVITSRTIASVLAWLATAGPQLPCTRRFRSCARVCAQLLISPHEWCTL